MKAGAADFVTKPWTNAQLLQAVETALGLAASRANGRGARRDRARISTRASTSARWSAADPRMLQACCS